MDNIEENMWIDLPGACIVRSYLYSCPALEFESQTGLTGIHTAWRMPDDLPHAQIEELIHPSASSLFNARYDRAPADPDAEKIIRNMYERIRDLNPELEAMSWVEGSSFKMAHLIMGLTSQFNLDDIDYYLSKRADAKTLFSSAPDQNRNRLQSLITDAIQVDME